MLIFLIFHGIVIHNFYVWSYFHECFGWSKKHTGCKDRVSLSKGDFTKVLGEQNKTERQVSQHGQSICVSIMSAGAINSLVQESLVLRQKNKGKTLILVPHLSGTGSNNQK